ncbi:hypothetical protein N790_09005 [Arenimonas malthae CC-JY-1]|uniref:histidine kinase n=1 Tax=Arenimonas malthae CC-JY-1 TaxID=1384054 RepID=A0A091B0B2_9GAMM|nr:ATP-binding protein [Arenimonas malthae]KFN46008.1 hypothetical protein N790_09005 [Arenimonas malthae CC-JY-1]
MRLRKAGLRSVSAYLAALLVAVGMLPMLVLGIAMLLDQVRREHDFRREQLRHSAETTRIMVEEFIRDQRQALAVAAADLAGPPPPPARVQGALERLKRSSPAFVTVMLVGADGRIVAGQPDRIDPATGRSVWTGADVSDREYYRSILAGREEYVSDAFRGRTYGDDLLVAVSRGVRGSDGSVDRVVQGSIHLDELDEWLSADRGVHGFEYVATDSKGMVIASSGGIAAPLLQPLDRRLAGRWPFALADAPLLQREVRTADGWVIWLFHPDSQTAAEFFDRLWFPVAIALATLLLVSGLVLAASRLVRRRALEAVDYVHGVAAGLTGGATVPAKPLMARTLEGANLVMSFEALAQRLREALADLEGKLEHERALRAELDQLAANQERWLDIRTRDLQELNRTLVRTQRFVETAEVAGRVGFWEAEGPEASMRLSSGALALLKVATAGAAANPGSPLLAGLDDAGRRELQRDLTRAWFEGRDFDLELPFRSDAMLSPIRLRVAGRAVRGVDGLSIRLVGALFDMTAQYEAEQKVRRLGRATSEVNDLMLSPEFDDGSRLQLLLDRLMNEAGACAVLGRTGEGQPVTVLSGRASLELDGEAVAGMLAAAPASDAHMIEPALAGHATVLLCRAPRVGGAGTVLALDSPRIARLDATDRAAIEITLRAIGALYDRVDATARLEAARFRLEGVARLKSELLAGLGHEIGGPLSGVNNVLEALVEGQFGELGAVQRRLLDSALATGLHTSRLIADLLDAARLESGQLALAPEWTDLHDVLEQAVSMVESQAGEKGQQVALRLHARVRLFEDPVRVRQMLVNLLANAVKYTPDGGRVWVSVRKPAGLAASVSVCDTGVGIHRADQADMARPFMRGADTLAQPGWGLGLAMVDMLTALLGARLRVHSRPGRGSRFTIDFPAKDIPGTDAPEDAADE